ncbi:DUF1178 family protein [Xanthobacter sediminis]|uniref:DUF1178 family protein n=1 Tax=Xanthobacter sediminis TaxID=3119926 RepID=UPI003726F51C
MILYTLQCAEGHRFESWFPSSSSYEGQRARQLVACPVCGSAGVEKAIMAPAVARTDKMPAPAATQPAPEAEAASLALMSEPETALRNLMRKVREHVVNNSDYVGDAFADLARKMHEGEVEHRPIYGEATREEVKSLREDEIEVLPLPLLPDERN